MHNYLILLVIISSHCFAFDYGKVRINLAEDKNTHSFTIGILDEQSNDLIDSQGLELRYLKTLSQTLRLGARFTSFNSEESENGKRVKEDLLDNGIIQNLELKQNSFFLESHYRLAQGVIKFFGKHQAQMYIDFGLGLGASNYEKTKNDNDLTKLGWLYSLELGAKLGNQYLASLQLSKVQDEINSDIKNNQTYLGLRVGYLW